LASARAQIEQGIFSLLLFEDARQFGGDLLLLPFGNGIHDSALFVDQAALTRRRWKEGGNSGKQAIMPVGDRAVRYGSRHGCADLVRDNSSHPCLPRRRPDQASTSRFPSKSTPSAVKIIVA